MPAESKAFRRLAGLALHHPGKVSKRNRSILSMSKEDMREFASTPEKGLPQHKRKRKFDPIGGKYK